jgi:phage-related holin
MLTLGKVCKQPLRSLTRICLNSQFKMKYLSGIIAGAVSFFAPVEPLLIIAMAFVAVDFLTGVLADRHRARASGEVWHFTSHKAWRTITKLSFVMAGIMLAWMMDSLLMPIVNLRLANIFAGFVCGVEFWSYLENATTITGEARFAEAIATLKARIGTLFGGGK